MGWAKLNGLDPTYIDQQPWCPPLIHSLGTGKHPVVNLSGLQVTQSTWPRQPTVTQLQQYSRLELRKDLNPWSPGPLKMKRNVAEVRTPRRGG
jgi:hypothetical protein